MVDLEDALDGLQTAESYCADQGWDELASEIAHLYQVVGNRGMPQDPDQQPLTESELDALLEEMDAQREEIREAIAEASDETPDAGRYRVVELPNRVAVFPVDDDPLVGLHEAVGDAFDAEGVETLTEDAPEWREGFGAMSDVEGFRGAVEGPDEHDTDRWMVACEQCGLVEFPLLDESVFGNPTAATWYAGYHGGTVHGNSNYQYGLPVRASQLSNLDWLPSASDDQSLAEVIEADYDPPEVTPVIESEAELWFHDDFYRGRLDLEVWRLEATDTDPMSEDSDLLVEYWSPSEDIDGKLHLSQREARHMAHELLRAVSKRERLVEETRGGQDTGPDGDGGELLDLVTEGTRFVLIQNIVGHPEESPSLDDLVYVNPSKSKSTIQTALQALIDAGVVERADSPTGESDVSSPSYRLTESGREFLEEHDLLRAEETLKEMWLMLEPSESEDR